MTKYRDMLRPLDPSDDLASVVGCGLDRLERHVSYNEIDKAIAFYKKYKKEIEYFPINGRRQAICDYINEGHIPSYIQNRINNV